MDHSTFKVLSNTTSAIQNSHNRVLQNSEESHAVEDRALERLGRLLSASASIFSHREAPNLKETERKNDEANNSSQNTNEEGSDTSSHLWQGISGNTL